MKNFTYEKYPTERHSYSLDPNHFMEAYSYVGHHIQLKLREELHDNIPLNKLDEAAKKHDDAYLKEKNGFETDHKKQNHIDNVWKADDEFINEAKNQADDPIVGNIAAK
jgi:hypothetical protein